MTTSAGAGDPLGADFVAFVRVVDADPARAGLHAAVDALVDGCSADPACAPAAGRVAVILSATSGHYVSALDVVAQLGVSGRTAYPLLREAAPRPAHPPRAAPRVARRVGGVLRAAVRGGATAEESACAQGTAGRVRAGDPRERPLDPASDEVTGGGYGFGMPCPEEASSKVSRAS